MHPAAHAASTPDKPAVVMTGTEETRTYGELDAASNRFAQFLRKVGVQRGDAIAFCMENSADFLDVAWGAQRAGVYYTAASSRLTAAELEYIVNDSEAKVLVMSAGLRDVAANLVDAAPNVQARLMVGGTIPGFDSYEDAVGGMPAERIPDESAGTDMLYSSGTTGRPKGVRPPLPEGAPDAPNPVSMLGAMLYGITPDSVYLTPAPLYHAAPLRFTMGAQRIGATVVVMEHFDPVEFLRAIETHRVTHTQVVPTMFVRLLKLPQADRERFDVSSLQAVIHAAAPCPVPVKEQMIEWFGPVIHEYYAGTEGNGFVACNSEEWLAHRGTVGKALSGTLHIVGEDGEEVPTGESGTVYFEGGGTFEYHNDPEKTAASRDAKGRGWSTLGDIGYVDDDGFLYLTDRKAYMIISGGVNIYPQEAENVLVTHPKVMDVAVFGVPNDDFGEEVKAVVQPIDMADAGPALERELIEFCKSQLSAVKCPRTIDFRPELPRHPTGKLYKRLLKDEYWKDHESRII